MCSINKAKRKFIAWQIYCLISSFLFQVLNAIRSCFGFALLSYVIGLKIALLNQSEGNIQTIHK